jgi:hypothetical protein
MAAKIGWVFPEDAASFDGFNDGNIEHFTGNPLGSLAREVIQNSLDAATGEPVHVEFRLGDVPPRDIPNLEQLKKTIALCLKLAPDESDAALKFFTKARDLLDSKRVPVLRVTDENTTGIVGPCAYGSKYFAYMKATGQSRKTAEDDLGSFGIGKSAPLAVSQLRTVIVSTVFERPDKKGHFMQYTQGKARLMGHFLKPDKSDPRRATGYWGIEAGCEPVQGFTDVPKWLLRAHTAAKAPSRIGTTLHIVGFRAVRDWEHILTAYVIENFFGAIVSKKLRVTIQGKPIDEKNIAALFATAKFRSAVSNLKEEPERFDNAQAFYQAFIKREGVKVYTQENRELGKCSINISVAPGMPKRVAVLRHGMFITDQLDKLKRFNDFKDFAAVVECHSAKGNELLRRMEPPKHNDFEPERLANDTEQQRGQRALKELAAWVREILEREARNPVTAVTDIEELADFFPDEGEQTETKEKEDVNPVGSLVLTAQRATRAPTVVTVPSDPDDDDDDDDDGKDRKISKQVLLDNVRVISATESEKKVSFTPRATAKIKIALYESGADSDRRLFVEKVTSGSAATSKGRIVRLKVTSGSRVTLGVKLRNRCNGAIKVVAYAV